MEPIRWAPKIRQAKLWQLYQNDALGAVDDALVEEVGYALLQRCHSIWLVTRREVECPRCGAILELCEPGSWKMLPGARICPTPGCGWETTAEAWHASWQHRDLLGTAAMQAVEAYLHDYPRTKETTGRMLCIDQLIHAFHISLQTGQNNRSVANNLIEGSHQQVVDLLNRLFALPGGADKENWRENVEAMWKRRRGQA